MKNVTALNKRIYLSPPDVGSGERELLLDAFDSNWIAPLGPHVDALEREFVGYLGGGNAAALSSGSAALHLALVLLGIGAGDRVICSSFTFAATANAIRYVGAEPIFLDSDRVSWNLDPDLLDEELGHLAREGKLPKAVVVVDLYGQCADYDRIRAACDRYEIPLIEDAAEALGAEYRGRPAGTLGDMAVFSFNGNKIITTSGGGMLVSQRAEWIERARFLATQARDPAPHYEHTTIGYNYRLSNLLAALGRAQFSRLAEKVNRRRSINLAYKRALPVEGISFMPEAAYGQPNCWLTCVLVDPKRFGASRDDIRSTLEKRNIEARPLWKPMHMQPVFRKFRFRGSGVSEDLFDTGLCLPSGSSLTTDEQAFVCASILEARPRQ